MSSGMCASLSLLSNLQSTEIPCSECLRAQPKVHSPQLTPTITPKWLLIIMSNLDEKLESTMHTILVSLFVAVRLNKV